MIDRLLDLYRHAVDRVVVVVNPGAALAVRKHLQQRAHVPPIDVVEQTSPTGMLDAILLGLPAAERCNPSSIWVTWCDQVAVHPKTIERLAERTTGRSPALVVPTVISAEPYIHLERDEARRFVRVLHRREGDEMPPVGESDMGVFALSGQAFRVWLPQYAGDVETGRATGERNFLPFIPWVSARADVESFLAEDPMEAIGITTPDDLARVESYLARTT